jgi:hypothetical protein
MRRDNKRMKVKNNIYQLVQLLILLNINSLMLLSMGPHIYHHYMTKGNKNREHILIKKSSNQLAREDIQWYLFKGNSLCVIFKITSY